MGSMALGAILGGWSILLGAGGDMRGGTGVVCAWVCWGRWCRVRPWVADVRCRAGVAIWAVVLDAVNVSAAVRDGVGRGAELG